MLSSKLPKPSSITDVQPGSLVLIPRQNWWAFGMAGEQLFFLHNRQAGFVNGKVADLGRAYEIKINLLTASRAQYSFPEEECTAGDLILFLDDGATSYSMVLGRDLGAGQLSTFEFSSGSIRKRGSADGEGLAYRGWRIEVPCSEDAPAGCDTIFSRPPADA